MSSFMKNLFYRAELKASYLVKRQKKTFLYSKSPLSYDDKQRHHSEIYSLSFKRKVE